MIEEMQAGVLTDEKEPKFKAIYLECTIRGYTM
jgi:hypothetical protein